MGNCLCASLVRQRRLQEENERLLHRLALLEQRLTASQTVRVPALDFPMISPEDAQRLKQLSHDNVRHFVERMLADKDTNLAIVPDAIEKAIYTNMFVIALAILNRSFQLAHLEIMDHALQFQLVPMETVSLADSEQNSAERH